MKPVISVVAPVYNEEGILREFYERVCAVLESLGQPWELILVNDGSIDRSPLIMDEIAAEDGHIRVIHFARNFGHQIAVSAGIDYAVGQAIVLIDADLQDPPEVILQLIEQWRAGYEVVYAVRTERKGETWFKRFTAKAFYRIVHRITDVKIPVDTGDFRLMDEKVADVLRNMPEHHRFIRGMTSWVGFRQTGVGYSRDPRTWGETKYPLSKMIRFALDGVTSFSFFPLQVMLYTSVVLGFLAIIVAVVISALRITMGDEFFGGQATTIVLLLLLSSFQLFFLFVMGQYVARTYDEARNRPLYIVASTKGFTADTQQNISDRQPHSSEMMHNE